METELRLCGMRVPQDACTNESENQAMSEFMDDEMVAKMKGGRCECASCQAGKHQDGRCGSNAIRDPEPPQFEIVEDFDWDNPRAKQQWFYYCRPCAEEFHKRKSV